MSAATRSVHDQLPPNVRRIEEARVTPQPRLNADDKMLVLPALAARIGLNEAIVLSQIDYWLARSQHVLTDAYGSPRVWVYNTLEGWAAQFPFWSPSTVRRTLDGLRKSTEPNGEDPGRPPLLIAEKHGEPGKDHTLWYTVDYEALATLGAFVQNEQKAFVQSEQDHLSKLDTSTNKETDTTTDTSVVVDARGARVVGADLRMEHLPDDALAFREQIEAFLADDEDGRTRTVTAAFRSGGSPPGDFYAELKAAKDRAGPVVQAAAIVLTHAGAESKYFTPRLNFFRAVLANIESHARAKAIGTDPAAAKSPSRRGGNRPAKSKDIDPADALAAIRAAARTTRSG